LPKIQDGRTEQAITNGEQAVAVHATTGHRLGVARARLLLGRAELTAARAEAAAGHREQALTVFTEIGTPEAAQVRRLLDSMPEQEAG
jgi:hypothetical protein